MTPAPSMGRPMAHPGSPSQHGQGPGPGPGVQMGGGASYGLPPPRPPAVSVGPPVAFPGGRELPALGSLPRTTSGGSSMSISSMLGGPSQSREPPAASFGPPSTSGGVSAPSYAPSAHASPRMNPSPSEHASYRRPHTPEQYQRMYEARESRNATGSPHGVHMTPEMQRYGTPQAFRHPPPPMGPVEHSREFQRGPGGPIPPPRPSSQPKSHPPSTRPVDMGRPPHPDMYARREELGPGVEYNPERPVVLKYEEQRMLAERERYERERFERDRFERERELEMRERERERRERTTSGSDPGRPHGMHPPEYGPSGLSRREPPPPPQYARQADPREQPHWQRPHYEQPRVSYEEPRPGPRQPDYPRTSAPSYGHPAGPYPQSSMDRFPPSSHPGHQPTLSHSGHPVRPFESPDRQRAVLPPSQHQQAPRRPGEDGPPPPSVAYNTSHPGHFESPRRPMEETAHPMAPQQNFLRVQEINRKGRVSPLPQAVQGAQPQIQGPSGEAGIKSEFGRMFSGIGSGVSGLAVPSPVASGAQLAYPSGGVGRRDDLEHAPQEVSNEAKTGRDNAARTKRRKGAKEDDAKGDEESNGRSTPLGRVKRLKTHAHHHHHQYVLSPLVSMPHDAHIISHHHHHHHIPEQLSPKHAGVSPFKNVKGAAPVASPTALAKDLLMTHHHAPPRSVAHGQIRDPNARPAAALPSPALVIPPKSKRIISNKAVLDSVAHKPHEYLGDFVYELELKPARLQDPRTGRPPRHAFSSTPKPLPMDVIQGKEGSTLMVKVGKQHLTPSSREEITSRRAVWGTDVYTDDSDVVAACIHGGWIRGEWPEDVDVQMLGLDDGNENEVRDVRNGKKARGNDVEHNSEPDFLEAPLSTGPVQVPDGRDMHVMVTILPNLERYTSTTRFGIKSREWGGKLGRDGQRSSHDGLSFMIRSVRFVTNGALPQSRLRGQARRERMRRAMQDVETSKVYEVRVFPNTDKDRVSLKGKAPTSDGDKENQPIGEGDHRESDATNSVKEIASQGPALNDGRGEQNSRDDDSGIGDVDATPALAANVPNAATVPTVASRLTPPSDASDA